MTEHLIRTADDPPLIIPIKCNDLVGQHVWSVPPLSPYAHTPCLCGERRWEDS
jgi:hypothetical protein